MSGFDAGLVKYGLLIFAWVGFITFVVIVELASKFDPRIFPTTLIAAAGIPISVLISTLTIFLISVSYDPSGILTVSLKDPLGVLAFFTEKGIEFSVVAPLSLIAFAVAQIRRRRAKNALDRSVMLR